MSAQTPKLYYNLATNQYQTAAEKQAFVDLVNPFIGLNTSKVDTVEVVYTVGANIYSQTINLGDYRSANSSASPGSDLVDVVGRRVLDIDTSVVQAERLQIDTQPLSMELRFKGATFAAGIVVNTFIDVKNGKAFTTAICDSIPDQIEAEAIGVTIGSASRTFLTLGLETAGVSINAPRSLTLAGAVWFIVSTIQTQVDKYVLQESEGLYKNAFQLVVDDFVRGFQGLPPEFNLIGGKRSSEFYLLHEAPGIARVHGSDFDMYYDRNYNQIRLDTTNEDFRQQMKGLDQLERMTNLVKKNFGNEYANLTNVKLQNTAIPSQVTNYFRVTKEVEAKLKQNTGQASTLNSLSILRQNSDVKYYTPTQIAPLKLKTNEYNQAKKGNLQSGINAARSNGTLTNLGKQQSIDDQARRFIKAANIDRPEESLDGNRLFYMVAETGHEVVNDHGNYRNKTSFDLYTFDLTKSTQTVTHVPGDYNEVVYAQYAQYAQINQNVKTLWLNYQTQVSAALGKPVSVLTLPPGFLYDPTGIPVTPAALGGTYHPNTPSGNQPTTGQYYYFDPTTQAQLQQSVNDAYADHAYSSSGEVLYPLMIDLPGSAVGFETLGRSDHAIYYNTQGDGNFYRTGWAAPSDGILVIDMGPNNQPDGIIASPAEMFGGAGSGFAQLALLDGNKDGYIDWQDYYFNTLRVWQDLNSNAFSDPGELRTLASYNIARLSLADISTPFYNLQNGNIQAQMASVIMTSGPPRLIGDILFDYSPTDVLQIRPDQALDPSTLAMPWIKGMGLAPDLIYALQSNAGLRTTVGAMMATDSLAVFNGLVDSLMIQWTGKEGSSIGNWVDPANPANIYQGLSQQRMDVLGQLLNVPITLHGDDADATKAWIDGAYDLVRSKIFFALLAQLPVGQGFGLSYDSGTDNFVWSLASDAEALGKLYLKDSGVWLPTINHAIDFFSNQMGLVTPVIVSSTTSSWIGGNTTDLLDGGLGVDTLQGGIGNDAYIWRRGDGNDLIIDSAGEKDALIFAGGVKASDVVFETANDGSVFVRDAVANQSIRFIKPGTIVSDDDRLLQAIEKFVFVSDNNQTINSKDVYVRNWTATAGNDTLNGTPLNDYMQGGDGNDWLQGFNGNDYLEGGHGNDNLDGYGGDDIYFFSPGDGQDTIREFDKGGNDTILLSSDVNPALIAIYKSGNDLVVKYSQSATVTVKDNFPATGSSDIEKIQLADGRFLSNDEIGSLVIQIAAYSNNGQAITSVHQVQNNTYLMNLIAQAF